MVTLAEVRRWDPHALDAAARALHATRDEVEGLRARLRAARPDENGWRGVAAEQARVAHDARDTHLRQLTSRLGEAVPVVTTAADEVADLLEELRRLDGAAVDTGYTITREGAVTDTASRGDAAAAESAAEQEDREDGAWQIRAGLGRLLERAARIDASLVTVLQEAVPPDPGLPRPRGDVPDVAARPVRGFSRGEFILPLPTTFPDRDAAHPATSTPGAVASLTAVAGISPASAAPLPVSTDEVVVQPRDPLTGAYDSLWGIAARKLGDATRWPEIFALNRGDPQPGGHTFDQPGLIFPGEHLRLPTTSTRAPGDAPDEDPVTPDHPAPTVPPLPSGSEPTSPIPGNTTGGTGGDPAASPTPDQSSNTTSATPSPSASPTNPPPAVHPAGPGVFEGPAVFVGAGLAVAVIGALLVVRRGNRHGPRTGPARRDDADAAASSGSGTPLPGAADGGGTGVEGPWGGEAAARGFGPGHPARSSDAAPGATSPAAPHAGASPWSPRWACVHAVGVRDGREIAFDLAAAHGLGIDGAGAAAAIRALTVNALGVNLLTATPGAPAQVEVLITAGDLADLMDQQPLPEGLPAGLRVVDDLEQVLDRAEAAIRARSATEPVEPDPTGGSTLVLVTPVPSGQEAARLQAALDAGAGCGVVGVLWGDWRAGVCVHAHADGLVWATDRGLGEGLRDVRLYGLSAAETPDLLALLYRVGFGADTPPEAPRHASPRPVRPAGAPTAAAEATAAVEETGSDDADSTEDRTTPIRTPVADDRATSAATEPPAPATCAPTPPVDPDSSESGDDDGLAGFDRIGEALAPPAAPSPDEAVWPVRSAVVTVPASSPPTAQTESAGQPDPPAPGAEPDEAADPLGHDEADAEPRPHAGSVGDALGDDGVVTAMPLTESCPITLRILGRPTLLVDRPQSQADDRQQSAGSVGVDPIDRPDAVEVTATLSARMRDLLVYLAVHPDGVRRDTAVAELWPDTGRQRPGNNLSSLISRLRTALRSALDDAAPRSPGEDGSGPGHADRVGPIVLVEGDRYRLDSDHIAVDYWTFLTDTAATTAPPLARDAAAAMDAAVLARLARAHGLYRGPLAEGIDHAWIPSVREATRRTFLALTARLVRHHIGTDPAAALAILETTRNLEPTNQSIYRDIMALQLRLGDNEAAGATLRLLENQLADVEESFDDATLALAHAVNE